MYTAQLRVNNCVYRFTQSQVQFKGLATYSYRSVLREQVWPGIINCDRQSGINYLMWFESVVPHLYAQTLYVEGVCGSIKVLQTSSELFQHHLVNPDINWITKLQ